MDRGDYWCVRRSELSPSHRTNATITRVAFLATAGGWPSRTAESHNPITAPFLKQTGVGAVRSPPALRCTYHASRDEESQAEQSPCCSSNANLSEYLHRRINYRSQATKHLDRRLGHKVHRLRTPAE